MKKALAMILAAAMLVSLAGCGTAPSGTTSAGGQSTSGSEAKTTLRVGVVEDPGSFVPYNLNMNSHHTTSLVYQRLFRLDNENQIAPEMAESYEFEGDTALVIKLKSGIVDSAGNPFTASDALFSLRLAKDNGAFTLASVDLDASEVVDESTLRLALLSVDSSLISNLAFLAMVTEKAYNDSPDGMVTTPVGTGPYKLVDWVPGTSVTFTYNENYWGEEPVIKDVEYLIIAEESQRTTALETGTADIVYNLGTADVEYVRGTAGLAVEEVESVRTAGLFFNCSEQSVCNSTKLRQAIAHAINREAITSVAFGGYAELADSFFSNKCADYTSAYSFEDYYAYDVDLAKQLMAESGVPEGTELELIIWSATGLKEAAALVQNMLSEIGLTVKITEYENTLYTDILNSSPDKYDLAVNLFLPPSSYSADGLFVCNMWTHMPEEQNAMYSDYYNQAVVTTDMTAYQQLLTECQQKMYEDTPLVSICHTRYIYGYNSALSVPEFYDLENLDVTAISWN
ncbi:MAG TPA: ABC transporter substrate-binding protein [Candidatus Fournierella merdigallinarum]|nr:ABC transporter substrate-binding protein [Candidatus Fournierella merdigallinarum]